MTRFVWVAALVGALSFSGGVPSLSAAAKPVYTKQVIKFKSGERDFYAYIPKSLKKGQKAPAVIAFHGYKSDANGLRWLIKPDAMAEKYGYIMIYPNGKEKVWNVGHRYKSGGPDDVSFASGLIDVIKARFPVDPQRVYAMGFSDGAQMVAMMACKMPSKFAAGAMVAHTMNIKSCSPSRKLPMAIIHGLKDKMVPFSGGGRNKLASYKASLDFFRQVHGYKGEGKVFVEQKTFKCRGWGKDKGPKPVVGCAMFDAGHSWPGGVEFKVETLGKVNKELNANNFLFDFFKQFKGKPTERDKNTLIATPSKKLAKSTGKTAPAKKSAKKKTAAKSAKAQTTPKKKKSPAAGHKTSSPEIPLKWSAVTEGKEKWKYAIHRPAVLPGDKPTRIVAVLGPKAVSASRLATVMKLDTWASAYQIVYALFPFDPWKKPARDAIRVDDALIEIAEKLGVPDAERHIVAWSDGGRIAEEIFCSDSPSYTTMTFIGYGWRKKKCEPPMALPLMFVHSKADKRHPFGGKKEKGVVPFKTTVAAHRERIGGSMESVMLKQAKDHRCESLRHPTGVAEIVTCTVDWGGNTIPGIKGKFPEEFGKTMPSLDVLPFIHGFMARHEFHGFSAAHQR